VTSDPAVRWLLESSEPGIRYRTITEILGRPAGDPEARRSLGSIERGPWVRALLAGQQPDGGFGLHPYAKWTGAHWRLVSLVDLGLPSGHSRATAATDGVLRWLGGSGIQLAATDHRLATRTGNGRGCCQRPHRSTPRPGA